MTFQKTTNCHSTIYRTSLSILHPHLAPCNIPMPEATPSILGPYVNECLGPGSLALITSTLSTPASWLVVRYLNAVLKGTAEGLPHGTDVSSSSVDQPRVSFINLLRPAALWVELAKKVVSPPECQFEHSSCLRAGTGCRRSRQ